MASKLKAMIAMWDDLMEVNGGAITPDKCWWWILNGGMEVVYDQQWRGTFSDGPRQG